jgi:hypothetical protein
MEKIPDVETAKVLMAAAVTWSVMKWLREKKRVRRVADQANAALDYLNGEIKNRWPADIRTAYDALVQQSANPAKSHATDTSASSVAHPQGVLAAKKVKDADDEAHHARMDAERTFDIAEKQLSTALAREGCRKAIRSWELHEKAIRKAEALITRSSEYTPSPALC